MEKPDVMERIAAAQEKTNKLTIKMMKHQSSAFDKMIDQQERLAGDELMPPVMCGCGEVPHIEGCPLFNVYELG